MFDAVSQPDVVRSAGYAPGEFPVHWHDAAYALHCEAWPTPWEGQVSRERFVAELNSVHVDVLHDGSGDEPKLLAYVKWKATDSFYLSRDELSDPNVLSLQSAPPAAYVCAYEISAIADRSWRGLGRRLLSETLAGWQQTYSQAVFCTYSPKRKLTTTLRRLAELEQHGRPALELFAHRAAAAGARHIDEWTARLDQSLDSFIRSEILPVPDEQMTAHLETLGQRYGRDVIDGVVAAIGIAYHFVVRARTGQLACGPAAFHRALGAEHWRQYPGSAANCADALALVDHWRYSHDPARRETCARLFREQRNRQAESSADANQLIVLA